MIIVAKKHSLPLEHYAVDEREIKAYPEEEWLHNPESLKTLLKDGKLGYELKATDKDVVEMTKEEKDGVTPLSELKEKRYVEIDSRTTELIGEGFTYSGKIFSMSRQAQSNMLCVRTVIADHRAVGTLAGFEAAFFPLKFNTLDDKDSISLPKVDDFLAFYDTAMGTVRAHLDGGTGLKTMIRAAVDKAEVDAVVDER